MLQSRMSLVQKEKDYFDIQFIGSKNQLDLDKIEHLLSIKPIEISTDSKQESDFIKDYNLNVKPYIDDAQNQIRLAQDRIYAVKDKVNQQKDDQVNKADKDRQDKINLIIKQRDEEIAQIKQGREARKLKRESDRKEKEAKAKKEQDEKISLVKESFPQMDREVIEFQLSEANWDAQQVLNNLFDGVQYQERKANQPDNNGGVSMQNQEKAMKLLQKYPSKNYEQILKKLDEFDWDESIVESFYENNKGVRIHLKEVDKSGKLHPTLPTLTETFDHSKEGIRLIEYLNTKKPVNNLYYKIYKDQTCKQPIDYLQLTLTFQQLNLVNDTTLYYRAEANQF